jgi:hypothetical protein
MWILCAAIFRVNATSPADIWLADDASGGMFSINFNSCRSFSIHIWHLGHFDIICYTSDIFVFLISFATHLTSWSFWYHLLYTSDILVILISFATHLTSWSFWYHFLHICPLGHFDIICYTKWYQNDQDVRCVANDIKMTKMSDV